MSYVQIQQLTNSGDWENVKITSIVTREEEIVVVGQTFRILVDGEEVYKKGDRAED